MGYRYYTDPIRLSESSADLTVACALVAQVPEVHPGSLDVDFTDWKGAPEAVQFLFSVKGACQDPEPQSIRVEGEADDDVDYPNYAASKHPPTELACRVIEAWGAQPAAAGRKARAEGFTQQRADLRAVEVRGALRTLDVPYALGEVPKEDYGQSAASLVVSRLNRFDFLNPRLRGVTLEETYQLRRKLLARHGIELAPDLAEHICLASVDPYNR